MDKKEKQDLIKTGKGEKRKKSPPKRNFLKEVRRQEITYKKKIAQKIKNKKNERGSKRQVP